MLIRFAKRSGAASHPRRPRHQGRPDRRPARGRAHGRRGALVRGRRRASVPHPARGEEPLRADRRDRRVRDDRRRPAGGRQPVRSCSSPSATAARPAPRCSPAIEGTRPLLVEIQALVAPTALGTPRRAVVGWDPNRLSMVLAVLEAHCGVRLSSHDVYLNVAGGLRIVEPAADLAAAAALVSSLANAPLPADAVYFGEVSLSGVVRPVAQAPRGSRKPRSSASRAPSSRKRAQAMPAIPRSRSPPSASLADPGRRHRGAGRTERDRRVANCADKTGDAAESASLYTAARQPQSVPKRVALAPFRALAGHRMVRFTSNRNVDLARRLRTLSFMRLQARCRCRSRCSISSCSRVMLISGAARHDPRVHARGPVDRGLGRARRSRRSMLSEAQARCAAILQQRHRCDSASPRPAYFLLTLHHRLDLHGARSPT